jgi:predicted transposase YdaD
MAKPADIGAKKIISLAPNNWARWATGIDDVVTGEILNPEFQWVGRQSDVLIRAESKTHGRFLLLNELQLRYSSKQPRRMNAYVGLAAEKYDLPVYPVLINILKISDSKIPSRYKSSIAGLKSIQEYRVINLWEVDVNIALQLQIPSLLPFVPMLKGGENEPIIREALQILRADEELNKLETVLAFFATFVLDTALVQDIMRWDMAVLRESPWYTEIDQRGRREGIISAIERLLEAKFGTEGLELMQRVSEITDLNRLQEINCTIAMTSTIEELQENL